MPASIRTTLHTSPGGPITGPVLTSQSRDDLTKGYQVVCESVNVATTYSWSLAFTPYSPGPVTGSGDNFAGTPSTAGLLPPEGSTSQTCKFNVDWDGAYLIRLVVDAGLPTEDTQFVRLRNLTMFGELKLVSAGERRDQNGVVPVDATPEGWARDQNQNLQRILAMVRRAATSGRVLYVDSNRGRNNAATPNDPTNVVRFPGPDPTALDESGVRFRSVGFADFSSINDAIAYALTAPARGEPAPGAQNPYLIRIQPGIYDETINLPSWVFLKGLDAQIPYGGGQVIEGAVITGGPHTYSDVGGYNSVCALVDLSFTNSTATTNPLVHQTGSNILALVNCNVSAQGNHALQGPAILSDSANPLMTMILGSQVTSLANATPDRFAIVADHPGFLQVSGNSEVRGRSGIKANPNLKVVGSSAGTLAVQYATIIPDDGPAIAGFPGLLMVSHCSLLGSGSPTDVSIDLAQAALGACTYDQTTEIEFTYLSGDTRYEAGITTGTTTFSAGATAGQGVPVFPTAPGNLPTNYESHGDLYTQRYIPDWVPPSLGVGAPPTVMPPAKQLPVNNAQDAIDLLVNVALPLVGSPFYSLNSAYDGLANLWPVVYGHGLGRNIVADFGAVQITGATSPMWQETDGLLRGGLQVEGRVDVGPLVSDGLGTEITLDPNPFGVGPRIDFGRQVWPNGITTHRGLPSAVLLAGQADAPSTGPADGPYHMTVGTRAMLDATTGEIGHTLILAGATKGTDKGGSVHLQAGGNDNAGAGAPGNIWMAPGNKNGAAPGRVWLANPQTGVPGTGCCYLTAANPYNVAAPTAGTFYVATVNGLEAFTVGAAMTVAALVTYITTTSRVLHAANVGGSLRLYGYPHGPLGDVYYVGDDQSGALNTKLGDLSLPAATFVPGSWPENISFACVGTDHIHFYGLVTADSGLGGATYSYHYVAPADPPYTVATDIRLVGVNTSAGPKLISLPNAPAAGRTITVKDETGNAPANPITIQSIVGEPVDGNPSVLINAARGSLSMYYSGDPVRGWQIY